MCEIDNEKLKISMDCSYSHHNKDLLCRVDVCDSKVEIVTPFWGTNSNGKVRAILNNKEFEQAIHQEICS
jgi:hypothetical protein